MNTWSHFWNWQPHSFCWFGFLIAFLPIWHTLLFITCLLECPASSLRAKLFCVVEGCVHTVAARSQHWIDPYWVGASGSSWQHRITALHSQWLSFNFSQSQPVTGTEGWLLYEWKRLGCGMPVLDCAGYYGHGQGMTVRVPPLWLSLALVKWHSVPEPDLSFKCSLKEWGQFILWHMDFQIF